MVDAAAAGSIQIGAVLADTYRITNLIGRGGMGAVFAAEHTRLPGKHVAIKVLHAEVAGDHDALARFRREAEIASRLGHVNIVDVHDFNFLDDGTPYLVLEYLSGEDMASRLRRGPIPLDETTSIVRQIGSALHAAHKENIVHRDLKPQNIFLCPVESGGVITEQVKVLDFGISKIRGSQTVKTNASDMLGTPQYMSPEQATGDHAAVDARTDVFALGAIVYEMLSGVPAFGGQTIPEVVFKVVYEAPKNLGERVALPPGVVEAVHRALSKKQDDRPADMSAFVEALTGSPLTTLRKGQISIAPSDGTPSDAATAPSADQPGLGTAKTQAADSGIALDATIDSGRRDVALQAGDTQAAAGSANTVAPSPLPGLGARPVPAASTATPATGMETASPATSTGSAEPAPRRTGLIVGIAAVVSAAVAAVAVVLLMSKGSGEPADKGAEVAQQGAEESAETPPEAPVSPPPPREKTPGESPGGDSPAAGTAGAGNAAQEKPAEEKPTEEKPTDGKNTDEKVSADTGKKPSEPRSKNDRSPGKNGESASKTVADLPGPEAQKLKTELEKAATAQLEGDADRAIHIARRSLGIAETGHAYAIMARAYCDKQDLGLAKSVLPHVKPRRLKRAVLKYCRSKQVDLRP